MNQEEEKKEVQSQMQQQVAMVAAAQAQPASMYSQPEKEGFFSKLASSIGLGGGGGGGAENEAVKSSNAMLEMDRNLSAEEMDSDDLGGDLNLSDQEDGSARRGVWKSHKA